MSFNLLIFFSNEQLTYLDRVVFKVKDTSRKFPAISNWIVKGVKKRVKEELQEGDFGRGKII